MDYTLISTLSIVLLMSFTTLMVTAIITTLTKPSDIHFDVISKIIVGLVGIVTIISCRIDEVFTDKVMIVLLIVMVAHIGTVTHQLKKIEL